MFCLGQGDYLVLGREAADTIRRLVMHDAHAAAEDVKRIALAVLHDAEMVRTWQAQGADWLVVRAALGPSRLACEFTLAWGKDSEGEFLTSPNKVGRVLFLKNVAPAPRR